MKRPSSAVAKDEEKSEEEEGQEQEEPRDRIKARKFEKMLKAGEVPDFVKKEWDDAPPAAFNLLVETCNHHVPAISSTACQTTMLVCVCFQSYACQTLRSLRQHRDNEHDQPFVEGCEGFYMLVVVRWFVNHALQKAHRFR